MSDTSQNKGDNGEANRLFSTNKQILHTCDMNVIGDTCTFITLSTIWCIKIVQHIFMWILELVMHAYQCWAMCYFDFWLVYYLVWIQSSTGVTIIIRKTSRMIFSTQWWDQWWVRHCHEIGIELLPTDSIWFQHGIGDNPQSRFPDIIISTEPNAHPSIS